jgi:hypothetical protein
VLESNSNSSKDGPVAAKEGKGERVVWGGCLVLSLMMATGTLLFCLASMYLFFEGFNTPGEPWRGWTQIAGLIVLVLVAVLIVRFLGFHAATAIAIVSLAAVALTWGLCSIR